MRVCPRVPSTAGRSATLASCARGVWGKPSRSACEVMLGQGHRAGNATRRSAGRGRGGSSQSDQFAPEAGACWWPRGRAAQACSHTPLVSCPLQTTEHFHVTPHPGCPGITDPAPVGKVSKPPNLGRMPWFLHRGGDTCPPRSMSYWAKPLQKVSLSTAQEARGVI